MAPGISHQKTCTEDEGTALTTLATLKVLDKTKRKDTLDKKHVWKSKARPSFTGAYYTTSLLMVLVLLCPTGVQAGGL